MSSSRTEGRIKRQELIADMVGILFKINSMSKQEQEKIPLPMLKNLKKELESYTVDQSSASNA